MPTEQTAPVEATTTNTQPTTETIPDTTITEQATPTTQPTETTTTAKTITLAEVAKHATESDCRTAINGTVYDVTAFFGKHPGGDKNLFRVCGIDATQVFERKHGGNAKANNALAGFEIGTLAQ